MILKGNCCFQNKLIYLIITDGQKFCHTHAHFQNDYLIYLMENFHAYENCVSNKKKIGRVIGRLSLQIHKKIHKQDSHISQTKKE